MKRRMISFLLSLVMVLQILAVAVPQVSANSGDCGRHIKWEMIFDMESMMGYDLVIYGDGEMDNFSEGRAPWSSSGNILSIEVSGDITSIGDYAFAGIGVWDFRLPSTLVRIGKGAFKGFSAWSINLPYGLETIGDYAFQNSALQYIDLPNSVTSIGYGAFEGAVGLTKITLSNALTEIPAMAFAYTSIASITIPESVEYIDDFAFYWANELQTIYGKTGSYAETWAKSKSYNFVDPDAPTPPAGPDAPSGLTAADSSDGITLTWDADPGVSNYVIHRVLPDESYSVIDDITGNQWLDREAEEGVAYTYRVFACSGDTMSDSAQVTCSRGDYTAPHSCTVSAAPDPAGGRQMVTVSVRAEDNLSIDRVELFWSADGAEYQALTTLNSESKAALFQTGWSWDISGLPSGGKYVKAVAFDSAGNASAEAVAAVTVDNTAPETPEDFRLEAAAGYICLNWALDYAAPADFAEFRIYRATEGDFALLATIQTIGYYDYATGIEAGVDYAYYITAVDVLGNESAPTAVLTGRLAEDTAGPVISDMTPPSGSTVCKQVTVQAAASDNYLLDRAEFFYCVGGSDVWIPIGTASVTGKVSGHTFSVLWDIPEEISGSVSLRVKVYDRNGHSAELSRLVTVLPYRLPEGPAVSVQPGFRKATLSWNYDGELARTLSRFVIWQTDAAGNRIAQVGTLGRTVQASYTVGMETNETRYYIVEAVDYYGASAQSEIITVTSEPDLTAPVPVIRTGTPVTTTEEEVVFYATGSSDNDGIATYEWDFDGDGNPDAQGIQVRHAFTAVGEYTVTLTVKDLSGNSASAETVIPVCQVEGDDTEYRRLYVTLVNAYEEGTPGIEGADVAVLTTLKNGEEFRAEGVTDRDGNVCLVVPAGECTLIAAAEGFISVSHSITVEQDKSNGETVALTPAGISVTSGELTVKEMTLEEIRDAGIDTENVNNHQVFQFQTELTFIPAPGAEGMTITPTQIVNVNGETLGWLDNCFQIPYYGITFNETADGGVEQETTERTMDAYVYPIGEHFVLVIYGETLWLKEMFNVELLVVNNNYRYDITDCVAELSLPEGLSLAEMLGSPQNLIHALGTIPKNGTEQDNTAKTNWYIRGDEEGEYSISAKVTGMINGEPFVNTFTTDDLVKVYAGSALKLTVIADEIAYKGEDMRLTYYLENVTEDRTIYDLVFALKSSELQRNVMVLSTDSAGYETRTQIYDREQLGENGFIYLEELKPGQAVKMELFVKPAFLSIMEMVPLGPLEVGYYLQDLAVVSTERSTTSIPFEWKTRKVTRGSLSNVFNDGVKDEMVDCGVGIVDAFIGAPLVNMISGVVKFAQFATTSRELLNDETVIETPSVVIRLEDEVGSFFEGSVNDMTLEAVKGMIMVGTDSKNYRIEQFDGYSTMTITGDAKIYVCGGDAGEVELKMTTWAEIPTYEYDEDEMQLVETLVRKSIEYTVPIQVTACTHQYGPDGVCTVCGGRRDFAQLKYHSLSLKGNIGINYYMLLSETVAADENAYMQFTYPDGRTEQIPLSQAEKAVVDGLTHYRFTATVSAKEMTDEIQAQFFYTGGSSDVSIYSVARYASTIETGNYDQKTKDLARAMLHYGGYAQLEFGYNTENLANAGMEAPDLDSVTAELLSGYAKQAGQGPAGAKLYATSLLLRTETILRFFFDVKDPETFRVTYEGKPLEVTRRNGYLAVDVSGIAAKDLDQDITLTVTADGVTEEVTYNVMTYCYNVLNNPELYEQTLIHAVKALYLYNRAAVAYFKP